MGVEALVFVDDPPGGGFVADAFKPAACEHDAVEEAAAFAEFFDAGGDVAANFDGLQIGAGGQHLGASPRAAGGDHDSGGKVAQLHVRAEATPVIHAGRAQVFGVGHVECGSHGDVVVGAAFAALLRVLVTGLGSRYDDWRPAIWALAVVTLWPDMVLFFPRLAGYSG